MSIDPNQIPEGAQAIAAPKTPNRSPRRRARELAVQGIYEWRVGGQEFNAIQAHLAEHEGFREEFKRADRALFETLLRGTLMTRDELRACLIRQDANKVENDAIGIADKELITERDSVLAQRDVIKTRQGEIEAAEKAIVAMVVVDAAVSNT